MVFNGFIIGSQSLIVSIRVLSEPGNGLQHELCDRWWPGLYHKIMSQTKKNIVKHD